jgi:HNH endonuclease
MKPLEWVEWTLARPTVDECIDWPFAVDDDGYGKLSAIIDGKRRHLRAHRWMWERNWGPMDPGLDASHLCHRRICVNFTHLVAESRADNIKRGRRVRLPRRGDHEALDVPVLQLGTVLSPLPDGDE